MTGVGQDYASPCGRVVGAGKGLVSYFGPGRPSLRRVSGGSNRALRVWGVASEVFSERGVGGEG